jgi:acyl carrier protein
MTQAQDIAADITDQIRGVLGRYGGLAVDVVDIGDVDDLFRAGMSSFANVNVMLALEGAFGLEFPESMLRRDTFESVSAIRRALERLLEQGSPR